MADQGDKRIIISAIIASIAMIITGLYITTNGNMIGLYSLVPGIITGILVIYYAWRVG